MNQAGIESGDFVLLRVQDTASHNQIVAAEIYGVDDYATLKKYKIKGNQIVLEPVSDNPENKEFKFNMDHKNEQGFVIHGIAVAVFKPLGPANRSDSG